MGKSLTERQKAARAAKADVHKQKAELGPLFADQAEPPDVGALMLRRRMGWSAMQEHLAELLGNLQVGAAITEQALRRLAREHLGPWFGALDAYRRRVYPDSPGFGVQFWSDRLTTPAPVVLAWDRVEDPSVPHVGVRLVPAATFPPEGWVPPLARADLPTPPPRCARCRYYHQTDGPCVELGTTSEPS